MTLPAVIVNDIKALLATEVKTEDAKRKLTGLLSALVTQFNDPTTPRAKLVESLSAFVLQFNALTKQTNTLWGQLGQLSNDANRVELTAQPVVLSAPDVVFK